MSNGPRSATGEPPVDRSNPWATRTDEVVYDNAWIRVRHHTVTTPTGTDGIYGHVHFKSLAVGVIPIDDEDHTWLVGQYRYAPGEYTWEIPEGGGPLDGDPAEAARRELREECGLIAATIEPLAECTLSNSVTDERAKLFVARDLTLSDSDPDPTERIDLWRLPVDEAIGLAARGELVDALSLIGLLRLAWDRRALC